MIKITPENKSSDEMAETDESFIRRLEDTNLPKDMKKTITEKLENNTLFSAVITKLMQECTPQRRVNGESSQNREDKTETFEVLNALPPFNPNNANSDIVKWLHLIEDISVQYNVSERGKMYMFQSKLQGEAKLWFDDLSKNINLSWEQWKIAIRKMFHEPYDFAQILENIVNKKKKPEESIVKYYQDMLILCRSIGVTGVHAVSCLIHGLPDNMKEQARAFKCDHPGDLLANFLISMEKYNYEEVKHHNEVAHSSFDDRACANKTIESYETSPKSGSEKSKDLLSEVFSDMEYFSDKEIVDVSSEENERRSSKSYKRSRTRDLSVEPDSRSRKKVASQRSKYSSRSSRYSTSKEPNSVRCFNCQTFGSHISKNCPLPKKNRCWKCKGVGHMSSECKR